MNRQVYIKKGSRSSCGEIVRTYVSRQARPDSKPNVKYDTMSGSCDRSEVIYYLTARTQAIEQKIEWKCINLINWDI